MRIIYWSSDVCSSDLLKDPAEMARLFRSCPEALTATGDLLACIDFRLDQLEYEYPHEPVPPGWTPQGWLEHLVGAGGRAGFRSAVRGVGNGCVSRGRSRLSPSHKKQKKTQTLK